MPNNASTTPGISLGGSELLLANLKAALPVLTSQVQIVMSRPDSVTLEDKPRLLWLHETPHDPALTPLKDPACRARFNRLVFCSHWQQQQYNTFLKIPFSEGVVIRNAIPRLQPTLPKPRPDGKLRFLYTSTPHRGLAILAAAAADLAKLRNDWFLDVYSSLAIYGRHQADQKFAPLYDQLRANPCVTYHGFVPNAQVRQACLDSHVWVYPSIFPETSCLAAQEAMMAGCLAITTNLGALPETCGAWAWMFPVSEQADALTRSTLAYMLHALNTYDDPQLANLLQLQSIYFQTFWSFDTRVPIWQDLLQAIITEGPKPI